VINFNLSEIFVLFALALATSWIFTGIMRKVAIKLDITDRPDKERKLQKEPIPYLGGLGIMLSLLLLVSIGVFTLNISPEFREDIYYLFIPALILGLVGLWDDVKNLSPQFRLMVQILMGLAGSLTITFGSTTGSITGNATLDLLVSIFWIVGITNAVNFFDNVDGGAAIACFISSFGFCTYGFLTGQPYIGVFGLLLMGVLAGFFIWNRRPARIYMGDSGALFLGVLLATITIRIDPVADSKLVSFAIPILFLALPILDTTVVVVNRIRNGRSPLEGGRDHLSHRLSIIGLSNRKILYRFTLISLLFQVPIFLTLLTSSSLEFAMVLIGFLTFAHLLYRFSKISIVYEH
jgi:UDP-GlcNAc:undecaprenyl-phosphate GlcNAc-1-phosphate transferase